MRGTPPKNLSAAMLQVIHESLSMDSIGFTNVYCEYGRVATKR